MVGIQKLEVGLAIEVVQHSSPTHWVAPSGTEEYFVRGRRFRPGARSAVVDLTPERGPRSSIWAWGAVRGHCLDSDPRSAMIECSVTVCS